MILNELNHIFKNKNKCFQGIVAQNFNPSTGGGGVEEQRQRQIFCEFEALTRATQ